jgi:hypothetical protein
MFKTKGSVVYEYPPAFFICTIMKVFGTCVFFLLLTAPVLTLAQLHGTVTTSEGEPLPFASVYLKGTSIGTTTNQYGAYQMKLDPGIYKFVFQYIGYETKVVETKIIDGDNELNVILEEENVILSEVEIKANSEDPAYEVIRNAIRMRKYYRDQINSYACRSYIKGRFDMLESPKKVLGQEVDFEGWVDSTGKGIVYLSESESKFYKRQPNDVKEVMISSKTSGDDAGFSFNTAMALDFSFYENSLDLVSRELVSPIAGNALGFYKYRLEGTFLDEEDRLVNKIKVIPKRSSDPVFRGYIYIYEDTWNIHSADLIGLSSSFQNPIIDTIQLQVVNIHLLDDIWVPLNKNIRIQFKALGFKVGGGFIGTFSSYKLNPDFAKGFFGNELFRVNENANQKSIKYWDSIRPVPLDREEKIDYVRKDSLMRVLDTTTANDGGNFSLLGGYTHYKNKRNRTIGIESPIFNIGFNAVQGLHFGIPASLSYNDIDTTGGRRPENTWTADINYGFAEKALRGSLGFTRQSRKMNRSSWGLSAGRYILDYNDRDPMLSIANGFYSLFLKENLSRFYQADRISGFFRAEIANGLRLSVSAYYAQRSSLQNSTNYSFFRKERDYEPNNPIALDNDQQNPIDLHQALVSKVLLTYQPGMKYFSYPGFKMNVGSSWPVFSFGHQRGWSILGSDVDYDLIFLGVRDEISCGIYGELSYRIEGGVFLNDREVTFVDRRHFDGNETIFGLPERYMSSFHMLPYYEYSTEGYYTELHVQHELNGLLFDRIPFIRKLGLRSVLSGSLLYTEEKGDYFELSFGLDNIGISGFRFLRVEVVNQFVNGRYTDTGLMLGFKFVGGFFN